MTGVTQVKKRLLNMGSRNGTVAQLNNFFHSLQDALVLGLVIHLKKCPSLTLSVVVTETILQCQFCQGYWSASFPTVAHPPSFPPSLPRIGVRLMLIFECVSAAVLTPACCQSQTRKETGFGGEHQDKKRALIQHYADFKISGPSVI